MKKLWLLLIPFLFISCGTRTEYGDITIHNDTDLNLLIQLDDDFEQTREIHVWMNSGYKFSNYPINRKYKLKVKLNKRNAGGWTTFIIRPSRIYTTYYIFGNETKLLITSNTVDGKSEDIEKIYPE